jgi:bifunctional DNase/RNase
MIEVDIAMVKLERDMGAPIVILREKEGTSKRLLPIWVGLFEALAIITEMEKHTVISRPMTHDLLKSVIEGVGAEVVSVLVSDLKDSTYYAEITLRLNDGKVVKIDSRPSDAMALALRTKATIYVAEEVMASSGISPDAMIKADDKDQLKAILENLQPEDFGKHKV